MHKFNKYFLVQPVSNENHAGSKARKDVEQILQNNGWHKVCFINHFFYEKIKKMCKPLRSILFVCVNVLSFLKIKQKSILFIQYPLEYNNPRIFFFMLSCFKKLKKIKTAVIIHDLNYLRQFSYITKSITQKYLSLFDYIISQNKSMSQYLTDELNLKNIIIELFLFDYITDFTNNNNKFPLNSIVFAGNLNKSLFCNELKNIKEINFNIYGITSDKNIFISENVKYKGQFSTEDIVKEIKGAWGLVWDGDSIDTCTGGFGQYLKYNTPHKLSLYLVANMPLIVWDESAIASYVKQENIGIIVKSLKDIPHAIKNIKQTEYTTMKQNVSKIANDLKHGNNLKKALLKIEFLEKQNPYKNLDIISYLK